MALHEAQDGPPDMPGAERNGVERPRPVDLVHLSRQTMGDRDLERDVLRLFVEQTAAVRAGILGADRQERLALAHGLKGSAHSVGAFAIAECAARIESRPGDRVQLKRLADLIDEVRDFVASISR